MNVLVALSCLLATFLTLESLSACNLPPHLWCSSEESAMLCKVEAQCNEWRKSDVVPVNFTLYYESLCPDCKDFFKNQLTKTYAAISDIMNLQLVPYGNAEEKKVGDKWVFDCQHGEEECIGNLIETCAINLLKDIKVYFPFISCMEASEKRPKKAANMCASKLKLNITDILTCSTSSTGNAFEHQMALKTKALQPDHQYVPWITLNGVHTEDLQNKAESNLLQLICDTYKGTKPAACNNHVTVHRRCIRDKFYKNFF